MFFVLVHIPSICFVQDKSDESNRPKYLKTYRDSFQRLAIDGYSGRVVHPVMLV